LAAKNNIVECQPGQRLAAESSDHRQNADGDHS